MADILDTGKSIYDILAEKRAMIEMQRPDVAAQLPVLGQATPGQRMHETAQTQPSQDLASSLDTMISAATNTVAGPRAKTKEQEAANAQINDVLSYLNPLAPKRTYGPNIGSAMGMGDNAGGILGLGIQPIDLLAFAIGGALTSGLPQDKALAATMSIASLPKQFRDSQEAGARAFIDDKMKQVNLQLQGENLAERQLENAHKQSLIERRNAVMSMVSKRLATGQPLNEVEQRVVGVLGSGVINEGMLKELTSPSIEQSWQAMQRLQQLAGADVNVGATIDAPGGTRFTIGKGGGGGGRPLTAGEISDALATGRNTDRLREAGFDLSTPQGRATAEAALAERRRFEAARLDISQANSNRAERALEMVRPEESKKLTALQELHRGASDMLSKYEASLASHGGKFDAGLQVALQAATTSPEGFIGKSIQALGQRYPKLTQADLDFVSRYASMQKFARGSLNDVGNLSNYERGIFQTMIGTPLDRPEVFRSRTNTAINDAARAYDQEFRALGTTRNLSQFPDMLGRSRQAPPAPSRNSTQTRGSAQKELPPPPDGWK